MVNISLQGSTASFCGSAFLDSQTATVSVSSVLAGQHTAVSTFVSSNAAGMECYVPWQKGGCVRMALVRALDTFSKIQTHLVL